MTATEGTIGCPPSFFQGTDAARSSLRQTGLPDDINKKTDL